MPAHLRKRKDRNSMFYLIDGAMQLSLNTKNRGIAEHLLKEFIKGKYGMAATPTVRQYYESWIVKKESGFSRKSAVRDYKQHFAGYLLTEFGSLSLTAIRVTHLSTFLSKLLTRGLSIKTCKNVLGSSFRALWRDAMREEIVSHNPFAAIDWPRRRRERPDPFTAVERDAILRCCAETDGFYYSWLLTLFFTGMRPSEASALRWADVDLDGNVISITKSRYMGEEGATKTAHSERAIVVPEFVTACLRSSPAHQLGASYVFINKYGDPVNSKKWSEHHWRDLLTGAGVRYRKFYATRHTYITEQVRAGRNTKEVADYCGTSVAMIDADYCGVLQMEQVQPKSNRRPLKLPKSLVAGPGFEPVYSLSHIEAQRLTSPDNYVLRKHAKA